MVFTVWEHAGFDSDQAIVGLMAKHLSEFRAFPVFFYGQQYMLGVQAWMAAPVFWVLGPSVFALKLPLVIVNVLVAVLLVRILMAHVNLPPALALVATLLFVLPPPGTSAELLTANGGSVEPYLYVLLLWLTRDQPLLLGSVLGIGFLHREFTAHGFVAIVAIEALSRSLFTVATALKYVLAVAVSVAVMAVVNVANQFSSAAGPGTTIAQVTAPSGVEDVTARVCLDVSTMPAGLAAIVTDHWTWLFGLIRQPVADFGVNSTSSQGIRGLWVVMVLLVFLALVRLAVARWPTPASRDSGHMTPGLAFPLFLTLTGLSSALVYAIGRCGVISVFTLRYDLLSLLAPVGLLAAFFSVERDRRMKLVAIGLILCWTAVSALGHARLIAEYAARTPPNIRREIVMELEKRGVRFGTTDYWLAYHLTFLANERIILATTEVPRILTYNGVVEAHRAEAVSLTRRPCPNGEMLVEGVYLCR